MLHREVWLKELIGEEAALMKAIVQAAEEGSTPQQPFEIHVVGSSAKEVARHVKLAEQAGRLDVVGMSTTGGSDSWRVQWSTSDGRMREEEWGPLKFTLTNCITTSEETTRRR